MRPWCWVKTADRFLTLFIARVASTSRAFLYCQNHSAGTSKESKSHSLRRRKGGRFPPSGSQSFPEEVNNWRVRHEGWWWAAGRASTAGAANPAQLPLCRYQRSQAACFQRRVNELVWGRAGLSAAMQQESSGISVSALNLACAFVIPLGLKSNMAASKEDTSEAF